MALEVEDGTGLANADAFVSVEGCTEYCEAHGLAGWTEVPRSPAADDEAAIRRATSWLSNSFTWQGAKLKGRGQGQAFPRIGVIDEEGNDVPSTEVPIEIVQACCIAAAYERENPGGLTPNVSLIDRVKSEQVASIKVEYVTPPSTADASRPVLLAVVDVISGLLSTTTSSLAGRAVRV